MKNTTTQRKTRKISYKKLIAVFIILCIAVTVIINIINSKNYNKKIELAMQAIYSEEKMDKALKNSIDVKAALAWNRAKQNQNEFENKLKEIKKDKELIKILEDDFKNYSARIKSLEPVENKIQSIEKPVTNGKIKEVKAIIDNKEYKFIFYKDKIIDILDIKFEESIFDFIFSFYNVNM